MGKVFGCYKSGCCQPFAKFTSSSKMSRDIRFPLGGELFLTVSFYKDRPLVHIRHFKTLPSWRTPGENVLIPTKYGVCLKDSQASQLLNHLPSALSVLKSHTYSNLPVATRGEDGVSPISPERSSLPTDQPEPPNIPMTSSTPRSSINPDFSNRLQMVYDRLQDDLVNDPQWQ